MFTTNYARARLEITDDTCRRILDYTWRRGTEILESNGGEMPLDDFYATLKEDTSREFSLPLGDTATDWIIRPAYWNLPVKIIALKGEGKSTITLLRSEEPGYKDDYVKYIRANLEKLKLK